MDEWGISGWGTKLLQTVLWILLTVAVIQNQPADADNDAAEEDQWDDRPEVDLP